MNADTVRRAQAVHPICDLQIEYSLVSRGPEASILPALRAMGVGVTAYGVLSRGLLTRSTTSGPGDFRAWLPRFTGDNKAQNETLVTALERTAAEKGVSAAQLAIAWVLARGGETVVPLVGSRTRAQLAESLAALDVKLTAEDVARLEQAVPDSAVAGTRYDAHQMKALDSER
jgi:aryl-alcohol dehydrogenase-like predicted oxidoreductase